MATFLIVEDEAMIAMLIEDCLEDMGHDVLSSASTVDAALEVLASPDRRISAAIVDVNLGKQTSWPVSQQLQAVGIPFCVTSGNADVAWPKEITPVPVLAKPFTQSRLEEIVGQLTG